MTQPPRHPGEGRDPDLTSGQAPTEFDDATLAIIGLMVRAAKDLPEEFWMITAMQCLAEVTAHNRDVLLASDISILVGVGAVLIREGKAETMAGFQAMMALQKAGGK